MIRAQPALQRFLALLDESVVQGRFVKLVLARHHGAQPQLTQVAARRVLLRQQPCLSLVYHYETRDVTHNLPVDAGLQTLADLLAGSFRHAHLLTTTEDVHLAISQRGQCTVRRHAKPKPAGGPQAEPAAAPASPHDRDKRRFVAIERPFLTALGVTDAQHRLVPAMARKWKQINKFVEVFSNALRSSGVGALQRPLRVLDFGSGKGYLTFAVHDHLHHGLGLPAQVIGVERRADMVALCTEAAGRLGLQGLAFEQGDIATRAPEPADVMIALHACDTATDHAIHKGIVAGAAIILCSPCCHQQIRPQLLSPQALRPVLQHGIHLGQEAEMLTDSLRALLLESRGYQTQVFEFVSLEHTSKNKMILAVKRQQPGPPDEALAQIAELKRFYGIREQCLETLLGADVRADGA